MADQRRPGTALVQPVNDSDPYGITPPAPTPARSEVRWRVTTRTNLEMIAAHSGVPVQALVHSVDPRTPIGYVEAATKGDAIMRAHEKFPRVPVEDLYLEPVPALAADEGR